jgi:hypothetical protein
VSGAKKVLRGVVSDGDAHAGDGFAFAPLLARGREKFLHRGLAAINLRPRHRGGTQPHDESPVVEGASSDIVPFTLQRVPDERFAVVFVHRVAVHLLRVDVVHAVR